MVPLSMGLLQALMIKVVLSLGCTIFLLRLVCVYVDPQNRVTIFVLYDGI